MQNLTFVLFNIFLFPMLFFNAPTFAQCHIDDWTALRALYANTDGDNWTNNTNWDLVDPALLQPPTICDLATMDGILIDQPTGRVRNVNLSNNGLNGTIPAQIGTMSGLVNLFLSSNSLSGNIPVTIGNMTNLSEFKASNNTLTGTIPPEIGNLQNLTEIFLSFNQLTGSIPSEIGNNSSLTNLNLSNNLLSGNIPNELGNLSNLEILNLGSNQLDGNIPATYANLSSLTVISLQSNLFSGCFYSELSALCNQLTFEAINTGNNFDVLWDEFCLNGTGACITSCNATPMVSSEAGDVYIEDACYGVILTSPNGDCFRFKVEDNGMLTSEPITCP